MSDSEHLISLLFNFAYALGQIMLSWRLDE